MLALELLDQVRGQLSRHYAVEVLVDVGQYLLDRTHATIQLDHAQDMLVAYLPEERLLVNADLWSPSPQALPRVRSREITLYENLRQLNLDVSTIVGIHGGVGEMADFERHLGPVAGTAPFVQR